MSASSYDHAAHNAQLGFLAAAEAEVANDDLSQLLSETTGLLEKLAEGNLKIGTWQMVLWQPRWVFAEMDGLCYQKVTADGRPCGRTKKILFTSVQNIEELEFGELVLQCASRDYTFKAPDENKCHTMVLNLRQLRERDLELRGS